jgi:hypothetical protein
VKAIISGPCCRRSSDECVRFDGTNAVTPFAAREPSGLPEAYPLGV